MGWSLALDDTVAAVRDALQKLSAKYGGQLVTTAQVRYRRDFNVLNTVDYWDLTGVSGDASAVISGGNLVITPGVQANKDLRLTGKRALALSVPCRVAFGIKIANTKVVNQQIFVELVAINDDNTLDETAVASWRFAFADAAGGTTNALQAVNGGALKSLAVNPTVNLNADGVWEVQIETDETWFHSRVMDSSVARGSSTVVQSVSPDPNRYYVPRIRVINQATAPAAQVITAYFVVGSDYTDVQAEIVGGSGDVNPGRALPVNVTSAISANIANTPSVTPGASTTAAGTNIAKVLSAATTNPTLIKSTAGRLYGYQLANTTAAWKYLRLYNLATLPVPGTSVPVMVIPIPPNGMVDIGNTIPVAFNAGLGYAITGASPDLDATVTAVGDVVGHIIWI